MVQAIAATRLAAAGATVLSASLLAATLAAPASAAQAEGSVTTIELPAGVRADRIAADPDGSLWFTDPDSQRIGRRSPSGVVSLFPLGPDHRPADIEWSQGHIWFATQKSVGEIEPDTATVTQYPVAGGGTDIAVESDGDVWLTQGSEIVRFDGQGEVNRYAVPSDFAPQAIVAGPSDAVWVTDATGGRVASIKDTGTVTTYPVGPGAQSGIALGSDQALWFAAGDRIDRITTTGMWSQGPATPSPGVLAAALDGNIWFASSVGVGRASADTSRLHASGMAATGVTADSAGSVWAASGGQLVRITTRVDPAVVPPRVSGTGHVGSHLMCDAPTWAFLPRSLAVQWYADGTALPNQHKVSLIPTAELLGRRITCRATAYFMGVPVPGYAPAGNSVTVKPQQGQSVAVPRKIRVAKSKRLPATTRQGQSVSYRTLTPQRCRIKRGPLRLIGRRAGVCQVTAAASGSSQFTAMSVSVRVVVAGKASKKRTG